MRAASELGPHTSSLPVYATLLLVQFLEKNQALRLEALLKKRDKVHQLKTPPRLVPLNACKKFVNHRAKRGGSLFQGGSGEREGSRSDAPPVGAKPPVRSRSDPLLAVGYPSVRGFLMRKLSQTLTDLDETWQE